MSFFRTLCSSESSEFSDMIPDKLTGEHFDVHKTFRHGLPNQPSCLAYDCVQELLAVGSHKGVVAIFGKAGLEKHFLHQDSPSIRQMIFIENKGLLVTRCSNDILYQWNITGKCPKVNQKLEVKDGPCLIAYPYSPECKWMYVGMDGGSIYIVDLETMELSDYIIHWDKVVEARGYQKDRPGKLVALTEQPNDSGKLLLAYDRGVCVLWNVKGKAVEKRFTVAGNNIMSLSWNANGKHFAMGCSDGSVLIYSVKGDGSPERVLTPHGSQPSTSPITQVQWHTIKPEPLLLFTGGFPEGRVQRSRYFTFGTSSQFDMISFPDPIISFLCLPTSPYATDTQRDASVAIVTETELAFYDTHFKAFFAPTHALSLNSTAVTSVQFCGNCPDTFVSQLHHIHSKEAKQWSPQPWPMRGGAWGDEIPDSWTDILVTGHANGAVKIWAARSVLFQPLLSLNTTNYFVKRSGGSRPSVGHSSSSPPHSSPSTGQQRKQLGSTSTSGAATEPASSDAASNAEEEDGDTFTEQLFSNYQQTMVEDDKYFAISLIELDVHSQKLCVSNCGGHTLVFDLSATSSERRPQSLTVDLTEDSALKEDRHSSVVARYRSPKAWVFQSPTTASSMLEVVQHCHCYYIEGTLVMPLIINAVQYGTESSLLAIGGNHGLALIDTNTNICVHTFTKRISLLYTADPDSHKKDFQKQLQYQTAVRKHTLDPLTDSNYQHALDKMAFLRRQSFPLIPSQMGHPSSTDGEDFDDCDVTITYLQLVRVPLDKSGVPVLSLWVGTAGGRITAYKIATTNRSIQLESTGFVLNRRSPVVSIFILNHRGERQLTPYRLKEGHPHLVDALRMAFASAGVVHSPLIYTVITTKDRIKSLAFPGSKDIGHHEPNLAGGTISHSSFFHCQGLPCLLNVTSIGDILIHSLPKLQHLVTVPYAPLKGPRTLHTFQVSGDGQAVYFVSASEIQRLSVTRDSHLNYPDCLPELYLDRPDPEPAHAGGIRGWVKGSSAKLDKDELFGTNPVTVPSRFISKRRDEDAASDRQTTGVLSRAFSARKFAKKDSPKSQRQSWFSRAHSESILQDAQTDVTPSNCGTQVSTQHGSSSPRTSRQRHSPLLKGASKLRNDSILEDEEEKPSTSTKSSTAGVEKAASKWRGKVGQKKGKPTNPYEKTREALDKRGRELSQLEKRTQRMASDAADFEEVAALLVERYK